MQKLGKIKCFAPSKVLWLCLLTYQTSPEAVPGLPKFGPSSCCWSVGGCFPSLSSLGGLAGGVCWGHAGWHWGATTTRAAAEASQGWGESWKDREGHVSVWRDCREGSHRAGRVASVLCLLWGGLTNTTYRLQGVLRQLVLVDNGDGGQWHEPFPELFSIM